MFLRRVYCFLDLARIKRSPSARYAEGFGLAGRVRGGSRDAEVFQGIFSVEMNR